MIEFNRKFNFQSPILAVLNFISKNKYIDMEGKMNFEAKSFISFKGKIESTSFFRKKITNNYTLF